MILTDHQISGKDNTVSLMGPFEKDMSFEFGQLVTLLTKVDKSLIQPHVHQLLLPWIGHLTSFDQLATLWTIYEGSSKSHQQPLISRQDMAQFVDSTNTKVSLSPPQAQENHHNEEVAKCAFVQVSLLDDPDRQATAFILLSDVDEDRFQSQKIVRAVKRGSLRVLSTQV